MRIKRWTGHPLPLLFLAHLLGCGLETPDPTPPAAEPDAPLDDAPALASSFDAVAVGEAGYAAVLHRGTWSPLPVPAAAEEELSSVAFLRHGEALAVGARQGRVFRLDAEGWSEEMSPAHAGLYAVAALGAGAVMVGRGNEALFLSDDGAWALETVAALPAIELLAVAVDPVNQQIFAAGFDAALYEQDSEQPSGILLRRPSGDPNWVVVSHGEQRNLVSVATPVDERPVVGGYAAYLFDSNSLEPLALFELNADGDLERFDGLPWRRHVTDLATRVSGSGVSRLLAITDGGGTPDSVGGALVLQREEDSWTVVGSTADLVGRPMGLFAGCLTEDLRAIAVGPGGIVAESEDGWQVPLELSPEDGALHDVACGTR